MEKKDEERAIEMTGGTAANLEESLDQWENEREIISQLHDENQAYSIAFRRFDVAMILASKVLDVVEREAGMFITSKIRDKIQQFRKQVEKLQTVRTLAQDVKETPTARSKPNARKQAHPDP
jgi:hypothetical protein